MKQAIVVVVVGLLLATVAGCGDPALQRLISYQVQAPHGQDRSIVVVSGETDFWFGLITEYTQPGVVITDEDGKVWNYNYNETPLAIINKDGTLWNIQFNGNEPDHWWITRENPNLGQKPVRVRAETLPKTVKKYY